MRADDVKGGRGVVKKVRRGAPCVAQSQLEKALGERIDQRRIKSVDAEGRGTKK